MNQDSSGSLSELVESYQPSPDVLKAMGGIKVLATVGPSASGKTTIMKALAKNYPEFGFILDETSREPRLGEKPGVDFLFRGQDEIIADAKNGELVQIAIGPSGDLYCTRLRSYPKDRIGLIPLVPVAIKEFRKLPIGFFTAVFIVPTSYGSWQKWFLKQAKDSQWSDEQRKGRLNEARTSFEFALSDQDIHFILNDQPQYAAKQIKDFLDNKLDNQRAAKAREIAASLSAELPQVIN